MPKRPARLLSFLETEQWVRPEGSTLKSLFDNLRNYPLLAIFLYVSRLLNEQPDLLASVAGATFGSYTFLLAVFTVFQTAILMASFLTWVVFGEWRERIREDPDIARRTRFQLLVEALRVLLFFFFLITTAIACFVTAWKLIEVFSKLKPPV